MLSIVSAPNTGEGKYPAGGTMLSQWHTGMLQPDLSERCQHVWADESEYQSQERGGSHPRNAHTDAEDLIQRTCRFVMLGISQIPTATTFS